MIYLDYAATTPMTDEVIRVYTEAAQKYFGNPESLHDYGSAAKKVLGAARSEISSVIKAEARSIYFTGSGTEANQLAILSLARGNVERGNHLITNRAEHSSVRNTFALLEQEGFEVSYAPVDEYGKIIPEELEKLIRDDTILASIQHANSEIGTIQPVEEIGAVLRRHNVLFHSDCVQTFGKIPVDVRSANLDSVAISAHKIYGSKGIGAAWIKPSLSWKPAIPSSTQEKGFRGGTVDVPAAAAFMAAARAILKDREGEIRREERLRTRLIDGLAGTGFAITVEGHPVDRMANIIGLRIPGMEGQYAMLECNRFGLAISTGSACSVGSEKPAAAMEALGKSEQEAREFIRISLGKQTDEEDIDEALEIITKVLTRHFSMVKL